LDHDSQPIAQIFADAFHGRESQQHLAATSGLGTGIGDHIFFCGNSAGTEPTSIEITDNSFTWQVD
jgi:hypothetical protein